MPRRAKGGLCGGWATRGNFRFAHKALNGLFGCLSCNRVRSDSTRGDVACFVVRIKGSGHNDARRAGKAAERRYARHLPSPFCSDVDHVKSAFFARGSEDGVPLLLQIRFRENTDLVLILDQQYDSHNVPPTKRQLTLKHQRDQLCRKRAQRLFGVWLVLP
jgi:hypothetical protein